MKKKEEVEKRVKESYGRLSLSFEANEGQFDSDVKFVSRSPGGTMMLTGKGPILTLSPSCPPGSISHSSVPSVDERESRHEIESSYVKPVYLQMTLEGANPGSKVHGFDELPGKCNYFLGNDQKNWRTNVSTFGKVKYEQVYRGIDLVFYGNKNELEYDFIVAPGASPKQIKLSYDGGSARISETGDLVFETAVGEVRQKEPVVYQELNGRKHTISAHYVRRGKRAIGLEISRYSRRLPLIIDPVLAYSTYLGGSSTDNALGIAVDAGGNAYITGFTYSLDFPIANPVQSTINSQDAFVTKLNASGTALVYSTYVGGTQPDQAHGIAIDSLGRVYVTGETDSTDFPLVNALQSTNTGFHLDAFVFALNSLGDGFVYSTYLGGSKSEVGFGIATDSIGCAYVTGVTSSTDFPTANALQPNLAAPFSDVFVSKIAPDGSSLVYSTYLGGAGSETGYGIATDAAGNAYITGLTDSTGFPLKNPVQSQFKDQTAFKSTDAGTSVFPINNGLPPHFVVNSIAIDPSNSSTIYSSLDGSGVFKSTDGGSSWNSTNSPITGATAVSQLIIDPVNSSNIFGLNSSAIVRSTDGGMNWSTSLFIGGGPRYLAMDSLNPTKLYAVNGGNQISRTTDEGVSWSSSFVRDTSTYPYLAASRLYCVTVDPSNETVYAGDGGSILFKSTDYGVHWSAMVGVPLIVTGIAVSPADPLTLYAWNNGPPSIAKSTDGGVSWSPANSGFGPRWINAFAIDPSNTAILHAATTRGLSKSTDGGRSWNDSATALRYSFLKTIAIDPSNTSILYVGTYPTTDCFIAKLNSQGNDLVYSTYLGSTMDDSGRAIAVDEIGNAYITGVTQSPDFPTMNAARSFAGGDSEAFVCKFNPSGALIYGTFVGGSDSDFSHGIAVDMEGNAYVTGITYSTDFPLVSPVQPTITNPNGGDIFIAKVDNAGNALLFSSYFGPTSDSLYAFTRGNAIAVDSKGAAYVTGDLFTGTFRTTPGAAQFSTKNASYSDGFVLKIETSPFNLAGYSVSFPATGGGGSVNVNGPAIQAWQATSNDFWITVTDPGPGSGAGSVSFTVAANSSQTNRRGSISIANLTFTIFQGAAFSDVPPGSMFYDEIGRLSARGITSGCGGGLFCPNAPVLRDQMAAFIIRAIGDEHPYIPISQRFADVPPSNPFYSFIEQMSVRQITSGCGGNNYCPSQPVLREQMAAFMIRAVGEFNPPTPGFQRFNDVPPSSPFYSFIDRMAMLNITFGCSQYPPLYCPGDSVTRAQMAAFLVRAFNL